MTVVEVNPGVCGMEARVRATALDNGNVSVAIETACDLVNGGLTGPLEIDPFSLRRPGSAPPKVCDNCHAACILPVAVVKAVEVEAHLALPRDAGLRFVSEG